MNKLSEAITMLEVSNHRSALEERLLDMLYAKEQELGEDISEEEAEKVVLQVRKDLLMSAVRSNQAAEIEEEWDDNMKMSIAVIRDIFEEMEIHYHEYVPRSGVYAFEMGVTTDSKSFRIQIYLEDQPRVCRIDAVYPFQAEPEFVYPLCEQMVKQNYPKRYGALQYDELDGELSYQYTFLTTHGLNKDDFRTAFMAVVASANDSFDVVKQYAVGRFRRVDRDEIICKAQRLIIELDQ